MKSILSDHPFVKWQYFGSKQGVLTIYPAFHITSGCSGYDPRYRPWYVETATSEPMDVVLVIDTSISMKGSSLNYAKGAALTVLNTTSPRDRIGVVSFSTDAETPGNGRIGEKSCFSEGLAYATPLNLEHLRDYVKSLTRGGNSNYGNAFNKAFNLLKMSYVKDTVARKKVILFLTAGPPNDSKSSIMQVIKTKNAELHNEVIIMTYSVRISQSLLRKIAEQDGSRYGVSKAANVKAGWYTHLTRSYKLMSTMVFYYNIFSKNTEQSRPIISIPHVDTFGSGLVTTISLPCYLNGQFIGVVGADFSMEDLLSDITYFRERSDSYNYAFMADRSGRTVMHPLLQAPSDVGGYSVDIRTLENNPAFNAVVFSSMQRGGSGQITFVSKRYLAHGGTVSEGLTVIELKSTYFWRPVDETNFAVGIVVVTGNKSESLEQQSVPPDFQFLYHRLDLVKPTSPCVHFGRYAVANTTVVKFGPQAFTDRNRYLTRTETVFEVESYEGYMTAVDDKNPGFKDGVRDGVVATKKVDQIWFQRSNNYSQYIVSRYIGTANGVFRLTPGISLAKTYDPTKRPWYLTALSNPGMVALSTPYIDALGAGVVITAAHTLYRGDSEHKNGTSDEVVAVMGADFPLSYFQKLLTDKYPSCENATHSCFVLDRSGMLIMHEDFLNPDITVKTLENVHISQKEDDITKDLLQKGFLVKNECRNFKTIKLENFYELKLPLQGVNTLETGQRCKRYQISRIAGTNAFLGIVLRESRYWASSCTCNRDKECSTARGLTCQCPCSAPLDFQYCLKSEFPASNISTCPVLGNDSAVFSTRKYDPWTKRLEKCFDPQCDKRLYSHSCEGVVGCYWCVKNEYNEPLNKPYCADINTCYGGKEGTPVPGSTGSTGVPPPWRPWRPRYPNGGSGNPWWVTLIIIGLVVGACYYCKKRFGIKCPSRGNTTPPRPAPARRQRQQRDFTAAYNAENSAAVIFRDIKITVIARSNPGFYSENNN